MRAYTSRGLAKKFDEWVKSPRIREFRFTLYLLRQSPLILMGIGIGLTAAVVSLLAPWIAPYGEQERFWYMTRQPPSAMFLLGTDDVGGDVFSRIIYALRLDLYSALIVVLVGAAIGIVVGALSGFLGGKTDEVLMRITDIFLAFPGLILAMAIAAALGRNWTNLLIALMVVWWPGYARLIRGQVLVEKEKLYVEAARAVGASRLRIAFRHVLPNAIFPLLVAVTLDIGGVMLTAAGLSFIGFGAQAGVAELGRMVSDGRGFIATQPWIVAFPGITMLITAVGFNLIGDGLRDVLDPRLRR
nr:ABC transporter permease [Candidatus Njordarchaeota archaeon]